jgi:GT2 family glycosyltransferase
VTEGNPGANGAPVPDAENYDQEEALIEMSAELEVARNKVTLLQYEVKYLKRELRRMRRNVGYRISRGLTKALTSTAFLLGARRSHSNGQQSTPSFKGSRNGFLRCSRELKALARELATQTTSVFQLTPSPRQTLLHKIFLDKGVYQFCRAEADLLKEMTSGKLLQLSEHGPVLNGASANELARFDLLIIEAGSEGALWSLFRGRFWPHQKVLVHGAQSEVQALIGPHTPDLQGPDFAFFFAPPVPWLDPRHPSRPVGKSWKSRRNCLTTSLPSGNPWPRISIITPTFNQGRFIEATLQSVLRQGYPNLEYLVLDGGSTDNTPAILEQFRKHLSFCRSEKDDGQADAINKGFTRSTGDIMAWLNSDDQYAPDALARVALTFDQFPEADIVVGGCGLLDDATGSVSHVHHSNLPIGAVVPMPLEQLLDVDSCWLKGHFFYQPEVFWRRRIWEAAGGTVNEELYFSFDYELWVRMARAGAKVVHIPDLLTLYRVHAAQKTYGAELPYLPELRSVNARLRQDSSPQPVLVPL